MSDSNEDSAEDSESAGHSDGDQELAGALALSSREQLQAPSRIKSPLPTPSSGSEGDSDGLSDADLDGFIVPDDHVRPQGHLHTSPPY